MTHPPATNASDSTPAGEAFVALWAEMGTHWGVPRTMAQVNALLFMEGRPLNTDEIMERLSISRGNASMTLRTLVEWGMITRSHNAKDRKDYYAGEQDVWKLFATVARTRKQTSCREGTEQAKAENRPDGATCSLPAPLVAAVEQDHDECDRAEPCKVGELDELVRGIG